LNPTGCCLWDLLEQPRTEDELADVLVGKYRITPEEARRDVAVFLDDLVRMALAVRQN
jgi:hypothetical protein